MRLALINEINQHTTGMDTEACYPVIDYIDIARITDYELLPFIPLLLDAIHHNARYIETLFIGLLALHQIRPIQYLSYLSYQPLSQIEQAKQYAIHYNKHSS